MENKCPHCGQPMPKSSAFCLHCMRGIHEKEYQPQRSNGNKKTAVFICCIVLALIIGGCIFAAVKHNKTKTPVAASTTLPSLTAAPDTSLTQTQPLTETSTQASTKETSTTPSTTAEPVTSTKPPVVVTEPPTTKEVSTTAGNQVVINGSVLVDYPNTKQDSAYTIPYAVSSISGNAFHGNTYLRALIFSKRANVACNWSNLFANLPNLEKIYIYAGTTADTIGMQYFDGEIIYYYD